MEQTIAIYIPTLGRSDRFPHVVDNIMESTAGPVSIFFIVERDDVASQDAGDTVNATVIINRRAASYAGAINTAWDQLHSNVFFCGSDDLRFTKNWDVPARDLLASHPVVGTNDLHNPYVLEGLHATHYLVRQDYIETIGGTFDDQWPVLAECYDHNYTDTEFIRKASDLKKFTPCMNAHVEHLHPVFNAGPRDQTFNRSRRLIQQDKRTYKMRLQAWQARLPDSVRE